MTSPPLNALRCFETAARLGSFKAAADHLCVTQSAVSHQIKKVEDWFGEPLFARESQGVRLLPQAEGLAQRLFLAFAEIETACAEARDKGRQPLVIAAIPSVAMCWLIPRLHGFREAHPDIETRVIYAMHGRDITFRDAHVAFVFAASGPDAPGIAAEHFLPGDSVPVCSPALLPDPSHPPGLPQEFRRLGLLHDSDTTGWANWLRAAGDTATETLSGAVYEDFNLLRAAALSGQGVALCAQAMIAPDLAAGRLVQLSDQAVLQSHAYYLVTGPSAQRDMASQTAAFRDWAMAQVRADQPTKKAASEDAAS